MAPRKATTPLPTSPSGGRVGRGRIVQPQGGRWTQRTAFSTPIPPPPSYGARPARSNGYVSLPPSDENSQRIIHMPVPKTPEQTSTTSPLLCYQETGSRTFDDHETHQYTYPSYEPQIDGSPVYRLESEAIRYPEDPYYAPATYYPARERSISPTPQRGDRSYDGTLYHADAFEDDQFLHAALFLKRGESRGILVDDTEFEEDLGDETDLGDQMKHEKVRYGAPPDRPIVRRKAAIKTKVALTHGNLVVNLPIATNMRLGWTKNVMSEMQSVRYTAVTCDPDDFESKRYSLRQNWSGRETELLIAITMYNEDEILLTRTLYGVMQGISHLCSRKNSKTWGQDAWKKVVVCIISDGRKNIHPRVLSCLAALGLYQEGVMTSRVKDEDVTAHVFEYTTTFGIDPDLRFRYPDKGIVPTQIIFCLKERNSKKINSHRWLFNAFGRTLQPNVCVLLDVGTRPGVKSLYNIWKAFDVNSNVGGACGEVAVYKGRFWRALLNPLVAAQNWEYKVSNLLDKPWESTCGYISVLPGAFSAYRYIALQNDGNGVGPLASYFKGEVLSGADADIFTSNMYLAEDRILCFELIAKRGESWVLKYVKSAVGETDVPDSLPEFIMQRRRWLNGSLFAAVYALAHLPQVLRSGHGLFRKLLLVVEAIMNLFALIFAWFGIANYYLFFVILTTALESPAFKVPWIVYINYVLHFAYAATLASVFILAMGNKPKAAKWKYKIATIFFAVLTAYMLAAATVCAVRAAQNIHDQLFVRMLLSVGATYGIYFVASFLALDPWHIFTSFLPYLFLSPMYLNVITIFAFCNLDDISWGTKEDGKSDDLGAVRESDAGVVEVEIIAEPSDVNTAYLEALNNIKKRKTVSVPVGRLPSATEKEVIAKDYYANVRTNVLLFWVLSNGLLIVFILSGNSAKSAFGSDAPGRTRIYMSFILVFVAVTSALRFLGALCYLVSRIFTH